VTSIGEIVSEVSDVFPKRRLQTSNSGVIHITNLHFCCNHLNDLTFYQLVDCSFSELVLETHPAQGCQSCGCCSSSDLAPGYGVRVVWQEVPMKWGLPQAYPVSPYRERLRGIRVIGEAETWGSLCRLRDWQY